MLDAHQHFWKVDRGDYGWMTPDLTPLYRDFGPGDLAPLLAAAGITRTVLIQAAETEAETDFLLEIAAHTDYVAGVVGWVDMLADDFSARLDHFSSAAKVGRHKAYVARARSRPYQGSTLSCRAGGGRSSQIFPSIFSPFLDI